MISRCTRFTTALLALICFALPSAAVAQKPAVVVSFKSTDSLIEDIKHVLTAGGAEELGEIVDGMVMQSTAGKGLAGIDGAKPLGFYMSQGRDQIPEMVLFVPVSDQDEFKDLLSTFFPKFEGSGNSFSFSGQGQTLYAKMKDGYCFISPLIGSLDTLQKPADIVSAKYDVSMVANLGDLPEELKQGFLAQLREQAALDNSLSVPDDESDAVAQEAGQQLVFDHFATLLEGAETLSIGFDINEKTSTMAFDIGVTAMPGSSLAKSMEVFSKTKSSFAGLVGENTLGSLLYAMPLDDASRQPIKSFVKVISEDAHKDIKGNQELTPKQQEALSGVVNRVVKVLEETGNAGQADFAVVANAAPGGLIQIVAAGKVVGGDDLSKALDDFLEAAQGEEPVAKSFKVDVAQHGGARIHSMQPPKDDPDAMEQIGDGPIHMAIKSDAVYVAAGPDSLAAVKNAIDQTGKPAGNRAPISLRLNPHKLIEMFAPDSEPTKDAALRAFSGEGNYASLEVVPVATNGAKMRMELGGGFMKLIGTMVGEQLGAL